MREKESCFRIDYTQYNDDCPTGLTFTVDGYSDATGNDYGSASQSVGPMMNATKQVGAVEFSPTINNQAADEIKLKSVTCYNPSVSVQ